MDKPGFMIYYQQQIQIISLHCAKSGVGSRPQHLKLDKQYALDNYFRTAAYRTRSEAFAMAGAQRLVPHI